MLPVRRTEESVEFVGELIGFGTEDLTFEKFEGFALSLTVANEAEAEKAFAGLTPGGQVVMPLTKTFFSPRFGMLTDRFGVMWMVMVEA